MSELDDVKQLLDLIKILKSDIGRLLGGDVTTAIVDSTADIKYIDNEIIDFTDFIVSFTKGNFELLSIGDHSLPLSGTNIAFFKISDNSLVILNSSKGPVGQLLAFKGRMSKYATKIDELLETGAEAEEEKVPAKAAVRVPELTVSIANKKFGMEEAKVLHLVNGENTISDICEKTGLPQLKVDEILRKYQKKKWIKLKRVIVGVTEEPAEKPPVKEVPKPVPKPEVPPAPQIPVEVRTESVYVFPIFEEKFQEKKFPKDESRILRYCDGQHTIEDIIQETSLNRIVLMEVIKKYEKKGKLKLTKIVPSKPQITEIAQPEPYSQVPAMPAASYPEIPAPAPEPEQQEEVVFDELMDILDQTQPIEMQPAQPIYQPPPNIPAPAMPAPASPAVMPVIPTPPAAAVPVTPKVPQGGEIAKVKPEPVEAGLFDDLASFLDQTAPMSQTGEAGDSTEMMPEMSQEAPSLLETPRIPVSPAAAQPTAAPEAITGSSLLEETEGIKITTYPEEDPLKNRLERLSNILEETTEEIAPKEGKSEVEIIGSKAVCPNCKTHVIMMAKVCPNCNRALRTCPNCKSPITLFARICPSCGSLL